MLVSAFKSVGSLFGEAREIATRQLNDDGTESVTLVKDPSYGYAAEGSGTDPTTFDQRNDPQVWSKLYDSSPIDVSSSTGPTRIGGTGAFSSDSGADYRQVMFTTGSWASVDMSSTWIVPSNYRTHTLTLWVFIGWDIDISQWSYTLAPCPTPDMTVNIFTYDCIRGDTPPCGAPVDADIYRDAVKVGTATTGGYYVDYPPYGTHTYHAVWSGYSSHDQTVTGNATITLYIFTPF